jgi:type IV pilus assembly protein PilQ
MKIGIVSNDVAVFLRVLDEVSDTTVVSNPKVLALNRQPARVLVGRKVGYLNTTSTDTATTQTVEFLDTGTQLYFRPFVSNDGIIRMELRPAVSEAAIRTASDVSERDGA